MKTIFVNRFFYPDHSATSQLLADLTFHLASLGWEVHVITSRQQYDQAGANLPPEETINGVHVHRIPTTSYGRARLIGRGLDYLSYYASAAWYVWKLSGRTSVVIAKTDPPLISVVAAIIVWLRGARLVNWLQDIFPEVAIELGLRLASGWPGSVLAVVRSMSLRAATKNVVVGQRAAAYLRQKGISEEQIAVIHNWADGQSIHPLAHEANALRRAWGLESRFAVMYSGNMGRAHEFDTILAAAENLLAGRREIVFLFVGGGFYLEHLERAAREHQLTNVLFKPYQPRALLPQSLGAADVHLISLRPALEGLIVPSKFYGIAAAGRPIIYVGDPRGEVPQIVQAAQCGTTVNPGDTETLVTALTRLHDDPALCAAWGKNARNVFQARFERSLAMKAWTDVLSNASA